MKSTLPSKLPNKYRWIVVTEGGVYSGYDIRSDALECARDARECGLPDAKVRAGKNCVGMYDWRP